MVRIFSFVLLLLISQAKSKNQTHKDGVHKLPKRNDTSCCAEPNNCETCLIKPDCYWCEELKACQTFTHLFHGKCTYNKKYHWTCHIPDAILLAVLLFVLLMGLVATILYLYWCIYGKYENKKEIQKHEELLNKTSTF